MDLLALSFSQCFIRSLFIYVYFWKWLCWARTHKPSTTVLPPRLLFVVAVVLVFGLFKFLFCFSFGGFVCFVFCFETWSPEVAQTCLSLAPPLPPLPPLPELGVYRYEDATAIWGELLFSLTVNEEKI